MAARRDRQGSENRSVPLRENDRGEAGLRSDMPHRARGRAGRSKQGRTAMAAPNDRRIRCPRIGEYRLRPSSARRSNATLRAHILGSGRRHPISNPLERDAEPGRSPVTAPYISMLTDPNGPNQNCSTWSRRKARMSILLRSPPIRSMCPPPAHMARGAID